MFLMLYLREKMLYYTMDSSGLRSAQLGALFSIKSHWTVSDEPATIVMPTGTGKTETMIATVVSEKIKQMLINPKRAPKSIGIGLFSAP